MTVSKLSRYAHVTEYVTSVTNYCVHRLVMFPILRRHEHVKCMRPWRRREPSHIMSWRIGTAQQRISIVDPAPWHEMFRRMYGVQVDLHVFFPRSFSHHLPVSGFIATTLLPIRRMRASGSGAPEPCPPGTASPSFMVESADNCPPCTLSFYCPEMGTYNATLKCTEGYYCPGGDALPTLCVLTP